MQIFPTSLSSWSSTCSPKQTHSIRWSFSNTHFLLFWFLLKTATAPKSTHDSVSRCWQKEECNFPLRRETWSIPLIVERLTKPSFRWKVSLCDKGLFLHLVIRPRCTEPVLKVHRHKVVQAARLRSQILPRLWIVTRWWPWQKPRFHLNK